MSKGKSRVVGYFQEGELRILPVLLCLVRSEIPVRGYSRITVPSQYLSVTNFVSDSLSALSFTSSKFIT